MKAPARTRRRVDSFPWRGLNALIQPPHRIAEPSTGLTSGTGAAVMRGDPHTIAATGRAAPPARVVFGRIVEKLAAGRIGASLYERKISVTEQIAR